MDDYVSRATIPRIRELLGITAISETNADGEVVTRDVYEDFPPFLYHPEHPKDPKYLFQGPMLFQVRNVLLAPMISIIRPHH